VLTNSQSQIMPRKYGLIGKTLGHSFSKKYFTEKFGKENVSKSSYDLFELATISEFPKLLSRQVDLRGLNVTIPYKQEIIPYLTELSEIAQRIGAVNVIKLEKNGGLTGHNSDYFGFMESLLNFIGENRDLKALVLGTGGASKAVCVALEDLGIEFSTVSRTASKTGFTYSEITSEVVESNQLIINTTPLGMYPNTEEAPQLPYSAVSGKHFLFDLVYNPTETRFMKLGEESGAKVKNGLEMLHLQAEKAWEIWNQ
jgi:shikimate dehydrogenase